MSNNDIITDDKFNMVREYCTSEILAYMQSSIHEGGQWNNEYGYLVGWEGPVDWRKSCYRTKDDMQVYLHKTDTAIYYKIYPKNSVMGVPRKFDGFIGSSDNTPTDNECAHYLKRTADQVGWLDNDLQLYLA